MNAPLRILIVEDSLDDAELLVIELENSGCNPIYNRVDESSNCCQIPENKQNGFKLNGNSLTATDTEQWFLAHVQQMGVAVECLRERRFDVVLLDLSLPDSFGLDTLKTLQSCTPDIPVVVLTGDDDREMALQAVALGAQDYLVKGQISGQLLERSIRYAIERKKAEVQTLKASKRKQQLAQLKLIHAEKMASLGQLVASVAHDINNPVSFIYANLPHLDNYTRDLLDLIELYERHNTDTAPEIQDKIAEIDLDFLKEDLPKTVSSMKIGAERICELVLTLRNFSRLDEAKMKLADIHEGIDGTLLILRDRLREKSGYPAIQIIKDYGNLPRVECYPGQLNQVFMNILSNAIDALHQQYSGNRKDSLPTITIRTRVLESDRVEISIKDNGTGIAEFVKTRLFEPFFTTKEIGKGTGLGLSISHQIVTEKHGGKLHCRSELGQGTEFAIEIPLTPMTESGLAMIHNKLQSNISL